MLASNWMAGIYHMVTLCVCTQVVGEGEAGVTPAGVVKKALWRRCWIPRVR